MAGGWLTKYYPPALGGTADYSKYLPAPAPPPQPAPAPAGVPPSAPPPSAVTEVEYTFHATPQLYVDPVPVVPPPAYHPDSVATLPSGDPTQVVMLDSCDRFTTGGPADLASRSNFGTMVAKRPRVTPPAMTRLRPWVLDDYGFGTTGMHCTISNEVADYSGQAGSPRYVGPISPSAEVLGDTVISEVTYLNPKDIYEHFDSRTSLVVVPIVLYDLYGDPRYLSPADIVRYRYEPNLKNPRLDLAGVVMTFYDTAGRSFTWVPVPGDAKAALTIPHTYHLPARKSVHSDTRDVDYYHLLLQPSAVRDPLFDYTKIIKTRLSIDATMLWDTKLPSGLSATVKRPMGSGVVVYLNNIRLLQDLDIDRYALGATNFGATTADTRCDVTVQIVPATQPMFDQRAMRMTLSAYTVQDGQAVFDDGYGACSRSSFDASGTVTGSPPVFVATPDYHPVSEATHYPAAQPVAATPIRQASWVPGTSAEASGVLSPITDFGINTVFKFDKWSSVNDPHVDPGFSFSKGGRTIHRTAIDFNNKGAMRLELGNWSQSTLSLLMVCVPHSGPDSYWSLFGMSNLDVRYVKGHVEVILKGVKVVHHECRLGANQPLLVMMAFDGPGNKIRFRFIDNGGNTSEVGADGLGSVGGLIRLGNGPVLTPYAADRAHRPDMALMEVALWESALGTGDMEAAAMAAWTKFVTA